MRTLSTLLWRLSSFCFIPAVLIVTLPAMPVDGDDTIMETEEPLTLLESLFPQDSFVTAYETYPLLSKRLALEDEAYSSNGSDHAKPIQSVSIPSGAYIEANGQQVPAQDARLYQLNNLFQAQYIGQILHQPNLEYKLVTKILRDGEEWLGIMPHEYVATPQDAAKAHDEGFSLVIDKLQTGWPTISDFSRRLQVETQQSHVSCNLYLTPPNASAFESHWDWMDVIVLQMIGKKTWSVASEPTVYLSNEELKHKPTRKELSETTWYDSFVLEPGDALYIPRGFLHNASTLGYLEEPSLHLTFGIEPMWTTIASLMLDAIRKDKRLYADYFKRIEKLENEIGSLRRSVMFHPSFQKLRPVKELFEQGVDSVAETFESTDESDKFRKLVKERYDHSIQMYKKRVQTERLNDWKKESKRLKAAMEAIGAQ